MRVLVTGAFGFVGTAVVRRLALAGHEVVALTHRPVEVPVPGSPASQVIRADLRDAQAIRLAVPGIDAVCHLAALTRVRESFERSTEYWQVNAVGTRTLLNVLAAAAEQSGQPQRFVHASTHAVYGAPQHQPITEDAPLAPTSPYGRSKADAERAVAAASKSGAIGAVCLRMFNAAGAVAGRTDTDQSRIIPRTLAVAAGHLPGLELNGDGRAIRDFVHVDDLASAYLLALAACKPGACAIYNVGATGASMLDVIRVAERVTGQRIPVRHIPPRPEPEVVIADRTRISRELSWAPQRSSLSQIIGDAWEVFRRL
jgi:UDP-glucose 4-epimerase